MYTVCFNLWKLVYFRFCIIYMCGCGNSYFEVFSGVAHAENFDVLL
jgi:hypothetical protein